MCAVSSSLFEPAKYFDVINKLYHCLGVTIQFRCLFLCFRFGRHTYETQINANVILVQIWIHRHLCRNRSNRWSILDKMSSGSPQCSQRQSRKKEAKITNITNRSIVINIIYCMFEYDWNDSGQTARFTRKTNEKNKR